MIFEVSEETGFLNHPKGEGSQHLLWMVLLGHRPILGVLWTRSATSLTEIKQLCAFPHLDSTLQKELSTKYGYSYL